MQAIFDVALPVFAIIVCGYLAGRIGLLGEGVSDALNGFTYYFALPSLFFYSLAKTPIADILDWQFIGATLAAVVSVNAAALLIAFVAFRDRIGALGLHALSGVFSNTGYMGIPLFLAAFGADGALPIILVSVVQSTTIFPLGLALCELGASQSQNRLGAAKDMIRGVALNPLLISAAAGIAYSLSGLMLPTSLATFFKLSADAAGPSALFATGLFMVGKRIGAHWAEVAWISLVKLVAMPAVAYVFARAVFALPDNAVRDLTIACALPTAALVPMLAQRFGVFAARASAAVLATTILSVATLSALMIWFGVR